MLRNLILVTLFFLNFITIGQNAFAQMVPWKDKDLGTSANFNKLTCRKFDYYNLDGNRKIFEVAISKNAAGNFKLEISDIFETLQPDHSYKEVSRLQAKNPIDEMLCTQAGPFVDSKVVTCRKDKEKGFDYLSIAKIDRTSVMSAQASVPAKIIRYGSYDIEFLEAGGAENEYRQFDLKDCELN